jgi:hypothetical protein
VKDLKLKQMYLIPQGSPMNKKKSIAKKIYHPIGNELGFVRPNLEDKTEGPFE